MANPNNPFEAYGQLENTSFQRQYQADRMMNMFARNDRLDMAHQNFRSPHGYGGLGGNPMLANMLSQQSQEPDYSQFTYNPQMKAAAEAAGVHPLEASQVNPNAFLPNTGFFGNHPRLSRMLEGGIFGAAATRGSDTIGEGISNVAGGLLEGQLARKGMIARQFAQPFQDAMTLERLEDLKQTRELHAADIEHLRAENERYKSGVDAQERKIELDRQRLQLEQTGQGLKLQQIEAQRPVPAEGGAWVYNPMLGEQTGGKSPWEFQKGEGGRPDAKLGGSGHLYPYFKQEGINPDTATPAQWKKIQGLYEADRVKEAGAMSQVRAAGADIGHALTKEKAWQQKYADKRASWLESTLKNDFVLQLNVTGKVKGEPGFDFNKLLDWYEENIGKAIREAHQEETSSQ